MSALTKIPRDKERTWFVLTVMTIGILLLIFDSVYDHGWVSAAWWGYGLSAVFLVYALIRKDRLLIHFFVFAVTAGFAELLADKWLVDFTKTLIYPRPEPMLLSSPAYMPFSWTVVLMEVGYIGWLIAKRWGLVIATIGLCVLGAMLVPLYETWAIHAKWWYYVDTPMFWIVPKYVILAEGLLMLSVPYLLMKTENSNTIKVILFGIVEGVVMFVACVIAFYILGKQ
ncbi:MAG: hypothetical protein HYR67_11710 [Bacteroidetes bacterium]|nr:hypothetical protein [Bacteroidota bacterium]